MGGGGGSLPIVTLYVFGPGFGLTWIRISSTLYHSGSSPASSIEVCSNTEPPASRAGRGFARAGARQPRLILRALQLPLPPSPDLQ